MGKFANYVLYKAENAGKYAVCVIAKGTTQDCSVCGKTVPEDLSVRIHSCPYCGSVMPRDYNAAQNIKLGHQQSGTSSHQQNKNLPALAVESVTNPNRAGHGFFHPPTRCICRWNITCPPPLSTFIINL